MPHNMQTLCHIIYPRMVSGVGNYLGARQLAAFRFAAVRLHTNPQIDNLLTDPKFFKTYLM